VRATDEGKLVRAAGKDKLVSAESGGQEELARTASKAAGEISRREQSSGESDGREGMSRTKDLGS
jgi:hypothetical protein